MKANVTSDLNSENKSKSSARVLMIAAEASSILYAQRLMEYWRAQKKNYSYFGVGSQSMAKMGFECFGFAEDMAVVGFLEVLQHYSHIKSVYHKILDEVKKNPPQVAVLLDYPGFNLRLAKDLHALKIPVVYYISPQIWAWKKNRVFDVQKYVSKMLVVFPFEMEFYQKYNIPVEFVGHPLLDEMNPELLSPSAIDLQRSKMGIPPKAKVLGLMPGSRVSEVEKMLPTQIEVARLLYQRIPNLCILVMVAPTFTKEDIADRLDELRIPYILMKDDPFKMIRLADSILAASGTATLMIGLMEKPMVIMYKVNALTAFVGRRIVKGFFGLVNLIMNREIVPEIFQEKAIPKVLAPLIEKSLLDLEYRKTVIQDLQKLKFQLGEPGVTVRAAKAIEKFIDVAQDQASQNQPSTNLTPSAINDSNQKL